jgi:hypothetical protein
MDVIFSIPEFCSLSHSGKMPNGTSAGAGWETGGNGELNNLCGRQGRLSYRSAETPTPRQFGAAWGWPAQNRFARLRDVFNIQDRLRAGGVKEG